MTSLRRSEVVLSMPLAPSPSELKPRKSAEYWFNDANVVRALFGRFATPATRATLSLVRPGTKMWCLFASDCRGDLDIARLTRDQRSDMLTRHTLHGWGDVYNRAHGRRDEFDEDEFVVEEAGDTPYPLAHTGSGVYGTRGGGAFYMMMATTPPPARDRKWRSWTLRL